MTVQTHTLPNGFRIVTERMPALESASIGVWIEAGTRHERAEQNGIAHFLEHMAFKGTARRSALEIAEVLEDVGGYLNAYTSRETTAYYARVLAADVGLALDVIADIILNPLFDPAEIEIERGVILQEIGQALDTPDDVIFDWLQDISYPDQPMGRTILGPAERVRAFGRDDLQAFVAEHYSPDRMILSAAGAIDHDTLVAEAARLFGHLSPRKAPPVVASCFAGGEHRVSKVLEQVHFALSFEGPAYRDDDFHVAQIASIVLGGGMSSRLFQEIREKRGLCYTIYAQAGASLDTGQMTIYAGTSDEDIADLARLTMDEIRRAAADIRPDEVARARAQMKAGLLMGLESPSNRAERLARMLAIWDRVPPLAEAIARIDAVTTNDVRAFLERMAQSKAAMALYGPIDQAPGLGVLRERLAG